MSDNYTTIVKDNLNRLYSNLPKDLAKNLPGEQDGEQFIFDAFGENVSFNRIEFHSVIKNNPQYSVF